MTYRQVKSVPGLEVTADAEFRYKDKPKKAIYCHTVTGRKATVRIMIMWDAKSHYWQAAKLVAEAWKFGYKDGDRITYSDGDCHNIRADNLILTDDKGYDEYMRRNSVMRADTAGRCRKQVIAVTDDGRWLHFAYIGDAAKWVGGSRENVGRCCRCNQSRKRLKKPWGHPSDKVNTDHRYMGIRFYFESDNVWTTKIRQ